LTHIFKNKENACNANHETELSPTYSPVLKPLLFTRHELVFAMLSCLSRAAEEYLPACTGFCKTALFI
jgi:hypothetical protein